MQIAQSDKDATPKIGPWSRAKWLFVALTLFIAAPSALTWTFFKPPTPNTTLVVLVCLAASIIGWIVGRDIWALRVRHNPLWLDVLGYVIALGGLGVLIYLRESTIFVWDTIYIDIFFVLLCSEIAAVAWITEARKGVHVGVRVLVFIHEPSSP
jgi:hypothetical protein